MGLAHNLQNLRKMHQMSQEDFAEKLNVSRQAVSKWESGESYPETEKIITICEMFDCKMDDLVRGNIDTCSHVQDNPLTAKNYDRIMTRIIRGETFGLMSILLGVSIAFTIAGLLPKNDQTSIICAIVVICGVILALPFLLLCKTRLKEFRRQNPILDEIYSQEVVVMQKTNYTRLFGLGLIIILIGVVVLLVLTNISDLFRNGSLAVAVLMYFVTVGESMMFYASKMLGKYDLKKYNMQNTSEYQAKMILATRINGVIMLAATVIFIIWGCVTRTWEMNWLVYLVALFACVIVNVIFGRGRRIR